MGEKILWASDPCVVSAYLEKAGFDLVYGELDQTIDLVITLDDVEVVKAIRKKSYVPIIACIDTYDLEKISELYFNGADDVFVGDHYDLLYIHIRALLRRTKQYAFYRSYICSGNLCIYYHEDLVLKDHKLISLTKREHQLLLYFVAHAGEILSIPQLYKDNYHAPYDDHCRYTIMMHVRHLREKLGHEMIETIYGQGYLYKG